MAALAAACSRPVPPDQARVCESVVPALDADGPIALVRTDHGSNAGTVQVLYRVAGPGGTTQRRILCRFGPSPLQAGRSELVGVETARGPVGGASLYLLKRYYLDGTDGKRPPR